MGNSPPWSLRSGQPHPFYGAKGGQSLTMDTIARSEFTFNLPVMPVRHMTCPARFERANLGFLDRGHNSLLSKRLSFAQFNLWEHNNFIKTRSISCY